MQLSSGFLSTSKTRHKNVFLDSLVPTTFLTYHLQSHCPPLSANHFPSVRPLHLYFLCWRVLPLDSCMAHSTFFRSVLRCHLNRGLRSPFSKIASSLLCLLTSFFFIILNTIWLNEYFIIHSLVSHSHQKVIFIGQVLFVLFTAENQKWCLAQSWHKKYMLIVSEVWCGTEFHPCSHPAEAILCWYYESTVSSHQHLSQGEKWTEKALLYS